MFDSLTTFVDGITSYNIIIPLWLQIGIISFIILSVCVCAYVFRDVFDMAYIRSGFTWYIVVAVINLVSILVIFIYYSSANNSYVGKEGKPGKKGKKGKQGNFVTCSFDCEKNIYLKSVRLTDIICKLSIYNEVFNSITQKEDYFENMVSKNININYDDFVNNIILGKTVSKKTASSQTTIDNFRSLMSPSAITISLINQINNSVSRVSHDTYGTFRSPKSVKYISLGDSVYGGIEDFELNSFMIDGNIMYPSSYTALVSFTSYNADTQAHDNYTIWRPNGQSITDNKGFKNSTQTYTYKSIGDLCRFGTSTSKPPLVNEIATIRDDCLIPLDIKDLQLIFIYFGNLKYGNDTNKTDYTQQDSYLIANKMALDDIEIFSVWRTPMNTFITNCNSQSPIVNNTLAYNMLNNTDIELNNYGSISKETKNVITELISKINIPRILVATIICKHYEIEYYKEIVYYFNKYQLRVPEFKDKNAMSMSFGAIMDLIDKTNTEYNVYNENLLKDVSKLISYTDTDSSKKQKKPQTTLSNIYDPSKEKHIPPILLNSYNSITNKLLTISVEIENTNTLLDIVNIVFDNGIDGRIAIDANGIVEGGTLLNDVQHSVLLICKMMYPPTKNAFAIKDDCLGTFKVDHTRESVITELTQIFAKYRQLSDEISNDDDKYSSVRQNIKQYEDMLMLKIGEVCGHIADYQNKINKMNLEEFTTTRLKQLINLYADMFIYLEKIIATS